MINLGKLKNLQPDQKQAIINMLRKDDTTPPFTETFSEAAARRIRDAEWAAQMQKESGSDDKLVAARPCRWQVPDQVQAEDFADPALYRHLAGIQDQIQQALRQSQYRARAKECGQLAQYDEMIKAARRTEREKQRERRGEGAEEKRAEGKVGWCFL